MKRVPPLAAEPQGLQDYRADNSSEDGAPANESAAVWSRFAATPAYKELLAELVTRQQALCAYCEQRLTDASGARIPLDYQVEHVLAKSGGPGRVLDWTNLVLCCGGGTWPHHADHGRYLPSRKGENDSCGQAKGDGALPPGTDPREFPWQKRLVDIDIDGRITPDTVACTDAGIDPIHLVQAIDEVLRLNCERLRLARKDVVANVTAWLVDLLRELLDDAHLSDEEVETWNTLLAASRLQPDAYGHLRAFWTTERQYLEPWSDKWIAYNHALLNF